MDLRTLLINYFQNTIDYAVKRTSAIDIKKIIKVINGEIKNNEICGGSIEYVDKYKKIKLLLLLELERRGIK